jgi:hypothetical protein
MHPDQDADSDTDPAISSLTFKTSTKNKFKKKFCLLLKLFTAFGKLVTLQLILIFSKGVVYLSYQFCGAENICFGSGSGPRLRVVL